MKISIKKTKEAYNILETYEGSSSYLKRMKFDVFTKKTKILNDFEIDYILKCYNFIPEPINRVAKIAKWYGEKMKEKWNVTFIPEKVKVIQILGETDSVLHVSLMYKQNLEAPVSCFIPKKALLDDLRANDYNEMVIDFTKYDDVLKKEDKSLYEHQKSAIKFLLDRKKCLLADDQGLGKTTSAAIASLEGVFNKVLIISPASIKSTWKRELKRFIPEDEIAIVNSTKWVSGKKYTIMNYDIVDLHYKIPTQEVTLTELVTDEYGNETEKTTTKIVKSRKKEIIEQAMAESNMMLENFDLVIIDECHKLSNNDSIRYQVIDDFLTRSKIPNVYLLSGTPMTNRPINLYNVLSLLKHEVCANYDYYVQTYCAGRKVTSKTTNKQITLKNGASNLEELMEKIKTVYLRRLKKDIPGMVSKSIHQRYYELTQEERKEYDALWADYEKAQSYLGKDNLNRDLTEGIFLRMFISKAMAKNTIQMADEFLEDENKVFIACCFDDEIAALKEYYGDKAVVYKGGMTTKQKDNAENKFMTDKNTKVFIGNIIAAGVGLTLTSSHICIFNSYDWVPGNNFQMMDRIHRIGQKEDVEVYYQLFSDTISDHMWNIITKKESNINKVIKEEKEK
jgi:SWI/SNF-related matrix-associated actin-dependent regulator 1 of chromatin subfamily A